MSRAPMRASVVYGVGEFIDAMKSHAVPVGQAATAAIRSAAAQIKAEGRADIAAAGFSTRWQNAFRVDVYPKGRAYSINAAAWVYHKIPYAGVFERGATIRGKPLMWIPLASAPKKVGRNRTTPERLEAAGVKLFMLRSKRGKPVLWANMDMGRSKFGPTRGGGRFTAGQLAKGRSGAGKNRISQAVPLFVGVSSVKIKKRLHIAAVVQRAAGSLARHYYNAFTGGS